MNRIKKIITTLEEKINNIDENVSGGGVANSAAGLSSYESPAKGSYKALKKLNKDKDVKFDDETKDPTKEDVDQEASGESDNEQGRNAEFDG